jgi:hypothetical protein
MPFATARSYTSRRSSRIELGALIAAACEEARRLTCNEAEAFKLATLTLVELLAITQNDRAIRDLAALSAETPPARG